MTKGDAIGLLTLVLAVVAFASCQAIDYERQKQAESKCFQSGKKGEQHD